MTQANHNDRGSGAHLDATARLTLLVLFFASGATGLIYQVVWVRVLTLTLSVTVYAVTTVLCAFMMGLALGAAAGGRVADRVRRPLLAYGIAEIGIAAMAAFTPTVLFNLGPAYRWLYDVLGGTGVAFGTMRFLLAFGVLVVPATLMGATLPLLSRAVITRIEEAGGGSGDCTPSTPSVPWRDASRPVSC